MRTQARGTNRLKPLQVSRFKGPGKLSDGGGLYLIAGRNGSRTWVFRYMRAGKAVEMGLGAVSAVPVANARAVAADLRAVLATGGDAREHRKLARQRSALEFARAVTFKSAAEKFIEANKAAWRNEKHAAQWTATLATYAYPTFGSSAVADVRASDVLKVLSPIWSTKPETASRLRGRIEAVLDYSAVHGWREGENPARWKGGLEMTLPARTKVRAVKHHAAMAYADVPAFLARVQQVPGMAALAFQFLILTAARTGEVLGARWAEIDETKAVWIVPAARMKAGREHRVPLGGQALKVLNLLPRLSNWVFPGQLRAARKGTDKSGRAERDQYGGLSNMALLQLLRRLELKDVTAHGFRSSFRDWAAEQTAFPREVIEAALAHSVGSKVEAAYFRSDLFEKRRVLMDAWDTYCATVPTDGKGAKQ